METNEQQLLLFRPPAAITNVKYDRGLSIDEKFKLFHANNPHVLARLIEMADAAAAANVHKCGIRMMYESLRWSGLLTHGGEYKLDNNFASRYVRMIISSRPHLAHLFETRRLKT